MTTVCFVLAKNPAEFQGGDVTISRLVMSLAALSHQVHAIALTKSDELLGPGQQAFGVAKPPVSVGKVAARSIFQRRSPFHVRFDVSDLRTALETASYDKLVAEHSYMAEPILASPGCRDRLWINTHVSEADVARSSRQLPKRLVARATLRDELRVASQARAVGCFDPNEISRYKAHGIRNTRLLDITLPPAKRPNDVGSTSRSLLFVGDQTWWPNHEALLHLMTLWPRIHAEVPDATLNVVGRPNPKLRWKHSAGARHWGFVDRLEPFLSQSRALVAPVLTGGGVRVKILEACQAGLPVVATPAGVGSLDTVLRVPTRRTDADLVDECVRMLRDTRYAAAEGQGLYDRNAQFWRDEGPARSVEGWLASA